MKSVRFFKTEAEYNNASLEYPTVSYTEDSENVWVSEPDVIIMTSESNNIGMQVCYAQGWAANETYMTKTEAEAVTDIGTAFNYLDSEDGADDSR